MISPDVNVLVYAARDDAPRHAEYRAWLDEALAALEPIAISKLVLSGVLRVLKNPCIFNSPMPMIDAAAYVGALRDHPRVVSLRPGARHWYIFLELCRSGGVRGNLVTDVYHVALAIELGTEWISTDRDLARFPGLRWRLLLE